MDDMRSTPDPEDHTRTSPDRRRPYKTPTLTEYGAVAKLTQNMQNGSRVDGNGMRQYGTCL
jgi:hypothetical protein